MDDFHDTVFAFVSFLMPKTTSPCATRATRTFFKILPRVPQTIENYTLLEQHKEE